MNNEEPLCKVFSPNTPARIDLLPDNNPPQEPLQKSYAGAFDALVNDLNIITARREAADRDHARRQMQLAERQAAEAQRNRRAPQVKQRQAQRRPLAKSAPVAAPPNFDRIAQQQDALEKAMRDTAARAEIDRQAQVKSDIRAVITDLRLAAKRGELSGNDAAKLDAMIGQAAKMGLRP